MEKKVVSNNYFDELNRLKNSWNSILYHDGNYLIKRLYDPDCGETYEKRENRLELLGNISEPEFVIPRYLVYTDEAITSNIKGYGMDYLEDYNHVSSLLNNDNYSHKEKLEICKNICDLIISLEKYKVAYWDVHSENLLIKDNKIRICDMDSVTSKKVDGDFIYRVDLAESYKHLTSLVLSILYGIDEFDLIKILERKKSRKFVKDSKMLSRIADKDGYIFYPDKYIDLFTEDYVEETKKALIKR